LSKTAKSGTVNIVAEHIGGIVTMCSKIKLTLPFFAVFRRISLKHLYINSVFALILYIGIVKFTKHHVEHCLLSYSSQRLDYVIARTTVAL